MIEKVIFIGAGNLATQLALALHEQGIVIPQVFSRTEASALALADQVQAAAITDLSLVSPEADLYIISVKDDVLPEVLENLNLPPDRFLVHTAGSIPMDVLSGFSENFGVFYPLQTFSKNRRVNFSDIPICLEANHPVNWVRLQRLAARISGSIHQVSSEERKSLHLAAVFVCNFVNHMYALGESILQDKKLDFDLLKPLIRETSEKINDLRPVDAQTGPAKRYDQSVIGKHLEMLNDRPELRKIYSFVTDSIFQFHQTNAK